MTALELSVAMGVARVMVPGFGERRARELARSAAQPARSSSDWAREMAADFPDAVVRSSEVERIN